MITTNNILKVIYKKKTGLTGLLIVCV